MKLSLPRRRVLQHADPCEQSLDPDRARRADQRHPSDRDRRRHDTRRRVRVDVTHGEQRDATLMIVGVGVRMQMLVQRMPDGRHSQEDQQRRENRSRQTTEAAQARG